MRRIPGWKPPVVKPEIGPDGEPLPMPETAESAPTRESVVYPFKDVSEMLRNDGTERHRMEQMLDVYSVKERLAHDGLAANLKTIKKALLIPEEATRLPSSFEYPNPRSSLMPNPWPKKKSKKKKGKKKK